ncbi:MAG: hypothetical protein K9W44_09485 [Candidatus Lokiarchaeota archaeon]|nr:hypothetical protein [Candidatus Harpocratesius repetitus]
MSQKCKSEQSIWDEIDRKIVKSKEISELNMFLFQKTRLFPFFSSILEYRKFKQFILNYKNKSQKIKVYSNLLSPKRKN